jgi:DNA mismatch repair protein MutS
MQEDHKTTPLMEQYLEIKMANPGSLLFFRMGDFYELFFQDAEDASRALGITLTKRGKYQGIDVPLAGVPIHTAEDYLQRLIKLGFRVSVCDQIEDPAEAKKRGYKSIVRRDVVRLVTRGTLTEDTLLSPAANNYLLSIAKVQNDYALAWADLSTGEFKLASSDLATLSSEIARLAPSEILGLDTGIRELELLIERRDITPLTRDYYDASQAEARLCAYYNVLTIESFGTFTRGEMTAAAALLTYIERTQRGKKAPLSPPLRQESGSIMLIDAATRANLEITTRLSGEQQGSLLSVIDRCVTASGSRLLSARLASPLTDPVVINARLDAVAFFISESFGLREILKKAPDPTRSLARIALDRGGPRDLFHIMRGLQIANSIEIKCENAGELHDVLKALAMKEEALITAISESLADDLPVNKRDGGFIRSGFDAQLDEARLLQNDSRQLIADLQGQYTLQTDIKTLKIKHNNVLGFFIEVTQQHGDVMLSHAKDFIHRQTLAGVMRFSTPYLSQLEGKIAGAAETALKIELTHFTRLEQLVKSRADSIRVIAENLATLDVILGQATLAREDNYARPRVDNSLAFVIKEGRHPVVEWALNKQKPFVSNDCTLSEGALTLMTGPNMAGKSTYLRQNALVAILAQTGGYVPASFAHIGVVDRLFSRVGAADDLARGRSTFMVEMTETATILNRATEKSLVILDEIGRGTATFDGLSIAWGALEYLHDVNKCRALFATHFHELTALSTRLKRLSNITLKVKEHAGDVVFLHEVSEGVADRSYGLQVAKLAGLPSGVITRARTILDELEKSDRHAHIRKLVDDLPLFANIPAPVIKNAALTMLEAIQPDDLSPKEALEAIYQLKKLSLPSRA